ncbi:MAG: hypothetical protein WBE65_14275 [Steroidobacteraceae bacterium]
MNKQLTWLLAALTALLMFGCSMDKGPAEQAVASAETSLAAVRDMAQKYVPDQLQAVETQLGTVKDSLAKGDYKAVLAAAPALTTAISNLKDAAAQKQAESEAALNKAKEDWGPLSADVPKMVTAIKGRVDELSKMHHLPKGVTKDALANAKSGLTTMDSTWTDATNASTSGDFVTAVSKAQAVKDQATQIMQSLKMSKS